MAEEAGGVVLVIGSDLGVAGQQERRLRRAGYDVVTAGTAAAGMREVRRGNVELIVLDYRLPELNGLEVYDRLKRAGQDLPVILVTDSGDAATILQALRAGVRDFVTKTAGYLDYLPEAVGRVLKQVRLEQQLAVSEARLAGVIHSAMDAIVTADTERHITLFNAAAERTFRCPAAEALGRPLDAFIPAKLNGGADPFGRPAGGSGPGRAWLDLRGVRADGDEFPLEASVSFAALDPQHCCVVIVRDVTEKKRLEAQFFRAQRLESLAGLAEGIANDLNNVLTPILVGVDLLEAVVPPGAREPLLAPLRASAERGADLVRQVLSFARGAEGNLRALQPAPAGPASRAGPAAALGSGELILVVDDETAIRALAKAMLEAHGYRVAVAKDGSEAVALYARHQGEIGAVVIDLMMPVLDGPGTIRVLQSLNPGVRVVAVSGLATDTTARQLAGLGVRAFLPKPYTAGKLLTALRDTLSHAPDREDGDRKQKTKGANLPPERPGVALP